MGKRVAARTRRRKILRNVLVTVLCLAVVFVTAGYFIIRHYTGLFHYQPIDGEIEITGSIEAEPISSAEEDSPFDEIQTLEEMIQANLDGDVISSKNVKNILLIGTDEEKGGRSDTMLLISINKRTKQIVMTSFLRDIYLKISKVGNSRLNAAYAYGGPALLIDTLEANFGIAIDSYVQIGFSEFESIIDILGGVTIELTNAEMKYLGLTGSNTKTFGGAWALRYARIRKLDSDFERTDRQRKLLTEVFTQLKSASISDLNKLLTNILPEVTTDLDQGELFSMVLSFPSYTKYELLSYNIPIEGGYSYKTIGGADIIAINDFSETRTVLIERIFGGVADVSAQPSPYKPPYN